MATVIRPHPLFPAGLLGGGAPFANLAVLLVVVVLAGLLAIALYRRFVAGG